MVKFNEILNQSIDFLVFDDEHVLKGSDVLLLLSQVLVHVIVLEFVSFKLSF